MPDKPTNEEFERRVKDGEKQVGKHQSAEDVLQVTEEKSRDIADYFYSVRI